MRRRGEKRRIARGLWVSIASGGLWAAALPLVVACGNGDDSTASPPASDAGGLDATTPPPLQKAGDACVVAPDAACNPCVAPDADPYNACSPFASGCIPFDPARVPSHPTL